MRKFSDYTILTLKGIAMGAADVVPGVSGGTIAFISGIYEELIGSIKSVDLQALKLLATLKFGQFWKKVNGNFLLAVVLGIAISIFSLAKVMTYLLETHTIVTWSFFFGLIIASSLLVSREIKKWNIWTIIAMIAGVAVAYAITVVSPATTPDTWWFIILSGAIAVCAMILPGISGSFILLLLGKYAFIMNAVGELKIGIIMLFAFGAVAGIISFSHILSWLLKNFHTVTISILTGFMIGSLNKVWPWKEVLETYIDSHGAEHPLVEANILPSTYETLTGNPSFLWQGIVCCVIGFLLIFVIEGVGARVKKMRESKYPPMKPLYGLIGYPLGHSFSAKYFAEKFASEQIEAEYRNFPLESISLLPELLSNNPVLRGFNVTIPYKEQIIPYLTRLDDEARAVGAVNCVRVEGGELTGYNTDIYGLRASLLKLIGTHRPKALILGSGGAAKAAGHVLRELGIEFIQVSRTASAGKIAYGDISPEIIAAHTLVINATPQGTFPDVGSCPDIPYHLLTGSHYLFDLVYNPAETLFLKNGAERGAACLNGMDMLIGQAEKAWEIWQK